MLQILDVIRYLKEIPDASPTTVCKRIFTLIQDLTQKEKKSLVELALKYPPSARAFLGAALDDLGCQRFSQPLRESLNLVSAYKLPTAKTLKSAKEWNIK